MMDTSIVTSPVSRLQREEPWRSKGGPVVACDSMAHQGSTPSGGFIDVPAHLGIAPTDEALRALLRTPTDLPLTQWHMGFDNPPRNRQPWAGLSWQVVGTLIPPPDPSPGYPYLWFRQQPHALQAWLWRVYKPPPPPHPRPLPWGYKRPYGELRWHPDHGVWLTIELRRDDGPDVAQRVWRWIHVTQAYARGRPRGSGTRFENAEDFRQTVVTDLRHLRENMRPNTQLELARFWYQHDDDPTAEVDSLVTEIKRYCSPKGYGIPWGTLKAEARKN
jgi:hypothetical protein